MDCFKLRNYANQNHISMLENEPMSKHTTFKIGGNARFFATASDAQAADFITFLKINGYRFKVVGNGSNLLVSDDGFDGVIVKIAEGQPILIDETTISCSAGTALAKLSHFALEHNLSGLEFAQGIPGTVGGAVYMNAGAYDGDISKTIQSSVVFNGVNAVSFTADEHHLAYRTSAFKLNKELIVLGSTFKLAKEKHDVIEQRMTEFARLRREKQPLEYPSAGSTFKRPQDGFAGKLIDESGLGGYSIGGAQVSLKHKGFVINSGNATCTDVLDLIEYIKSVVFDRFNVMLELEVELL